MQRCKNYVERRQKCQTFPHLLPREATDQYEPNSVARLLMNSTYLPPHLQSILPNRSLPFRHCYGLFQSITGRFGGVGGGVTGGVTEGGRGKFICWGAEGAVGGTLP